MPPLKKTNIHHWPFPVYGKISEHTRKTILPKPNISQATQAILKLRRKSNPFLGIEDALL